MGYLHYKSNQTSRSESVYFNSDSDPDQGGEKNATADPCGSGTQSLPHNSTFLESGEDGNVARSDLLHLPVVISKGHQQPTKLLTQPAVQVIHAALQKVNQLKWVNVQHRHRIGIYRYLLPYILLRKKEKRQDARVYKHFNAIMIFCSIQNFPDR